MSAHKYIVVVDPASHTPEVNCFNQIATLATCPVHYHLPGIHGIKSLIQADCLPSPRGIICLGSGQSVLDDSSQWQRDLGQWLKGQIVDNIACLAICYGHQLVADLFGGRVEFIDKDHTKQRGTREHSFSSNRLIGPESGPLIVSHREIVTTAPLGFTQIATHEHFGCEALEHESKPVWSFQAHPEASRSFLENNAVEVAQPGPAMKFGQSIIEAFLGVCLAQ